MRRKSLLPAVLLRFSILMLAPGLASAASAHQGLLAAHAAHRAVAVSGPVISVTPGAHDFGRVNAGDFAGSFDFVISNDGVADLHITEATESRPGSGFTATIPGTIPPGETGLLTVTWTATGSGPISDNFTIRSDAENGPYVILAYGISNNAPQFDPPLLATYFADAFVPFALTATAVDPEGDPLDWSVASAPALPVGATFDHTNGALTWTPDPGNAGDYAVTITVSDGVASTDGAFTLRVRAANSPPVANPGGPYTGFTNIPLQLDGTASSDPDAGQTLTYAWDLGDGTTATGPLPVHTYTSANVYTVSLTVTDSDGLHLQATAATAAEILDYIEAVLVPDATSAKVIRTSGNGEQQFGLWMLLRPLTDVDPSTIRMSTTYPNAGTVTSIKIDDKRLKLGDLDQNHFRDLDFSFRTSDVRALLGRVPNGQAITIVVTARALSDGFRIRSALDVVKQGSSGSVSVVAAPFHAEIPISYSVEGNGAVSLRIFSVAGRLVRSLAEAPAAAGTYQAHWNGHDESGRRVPSGIYFVRVEQNGVSSTRKLSVLR
jgi:hypothetical protein